MRKLFNFKSITNLFTNMKQRLLYGFLLLFVCVTSSIRAWALEKDVEGVYQIGTAQDLIDFAALVNAGEYGANAVLTDDITLTDVWETPIGVITGEENGDAGPGAYVGTFDGQGHKITGFNAESKDLGHGGLFGDTRGAVIKNFSIEGTLTVSAGHGAGVIAYPANSTITGVHSYLDISVPVAGVCHVGGVVGSSRGGNTITNCTFNGTMTIAAGSYDCFGGIAGYGGDNISFCANYATITFYERGCYVGGITGYVNNTSTYVRNCLNMGSLVYNYPENAEESEKTPTYGSAIVGRLRGHDLAKMTGNCWLEGSAKGAGINDSGTDDLAQALCFTSDKLATGEVCYALNGDQSEIGWYQTLPTDNAPVLDPTHGQVYMVGHLHCNGDVYDGTTYNNQSTSIIQDEHDFVDGFCSYCALIDENFKTPNADGFYEIDNAKQLVWFEKMVNTLGKDSLNAVLTADIDFAELTVDPKFTWTAIGDWGGVSGTASAAYRGHFDGQGHKILNFDVTSTHNYYGIFGVISNGSLVENFDIYGTLNLGHKTGGVVGYTRDTECTIRNIHSYMTINVTEAATTAERPGGIVGSAVNGTTNVENCIYSGTLNVGGHTGNIGGIVGYINNNKAAIVNITNCLFDGEIQNGTSAAGQCGGIVGYNNAGKATIKNCLSIGTIVASDGNIGQIIGCLNGSNTTYNNNYYSGEFVNGTNSGKTAKGTEPVQVTESRLGNGEITWLLNEKTFIDPVWHQNLAEDEYPLPLGNNAIVYQTSAGGYENIDDESIANFIADIIETEKEFLEDGELVAYNALVNEYQEAIDSWEAIDNYNDFIAAYKAALELKESIKKSIASYERYVQTCESTATYIEENNLEGVWTEYLLTYLQDEVEPGTDYPNGSYSYIMDNRNLDDEAIAAEIAFVNQMLETAIAGGIIPGTDITRLFKNTDFSEVEDHFAGWTKEGEEGISFATGGETSTMRIARGLGKGSFNISQTLNELPNGVYMMSVNAMFRSGSEITDQFYAGQLYLNGTANYVMSPGEDVILEENAEPGVNCLGEGVDNLYDFDGIVGWVPNGMSGCPVAYGAGRYQNFCATEVTDGTLTVGMRSLGTGLDSDWLPFGNLHVYYLGTADEADEKLAEVLEGFVARAQAIIDFKGTDEDEGLYATRPNVYTGLKDQLTDAIDAVAEATTGEKKLALINTFSALFAEVHACRKAYVEMAAAAMKLSGSLDNLLIAGIIDDDDYLRYDGEISDVLYIYAIDGSLSTEQAIAKTKELSFADELMPLVDGVYQLSTPQQLLLFSIFVNGGQPNLKAVLTNDIDMSEVIEIFEPIGNSSLPFTGEFDGQGFKITGFGQYDAEEDSYNLTFSSNAQGFFGRVNGATVKNFSIEGKVAITGGKYYGAIGQAEKSTISNVHSYLDINVIASGVHHTAGVVGSTESNANCTISGCSYSGNMTIAAGSTDNFAGVVGYLGGDKVIDCVNYGTISFKDAGCAAGGVAGYLNNTSTYIQNCLNVGTVHCEVSDSPKYGGAIVGRIKSNWSSEKIVNNYWQEGTAYGPAKKDDGSSPATASTCTAAQLASGEICYKLNAGKQGEDIVWFQTLLEDATPVLDNTHLIVLYTDELGYHNEGSDPDAIKSVTPALPKVEGVIYNLAGQRMNRLQKGINIVGNKKVLY